MSSVINGSGATDYCAQFLDKDAKAVKIYTVNLGCAGKYSEQKKIQ
jgi:hypothetical protein